MTPNKSEGKPGRNIVRDFFVGLVPGVVSYRYLHIYRNVTGPKNGDRQKNKSHLYDLIVPAADIGTTIIEFLSMVLDPSSSMGLYTFALTRAVFGSINALY